MKRTMFVSTKMDKDSDAIRTELTLDFSTLSNDDVLEYAIDAIVVKWQGNARRKSTIPTKATYTVPKPGTRVAESVEDRIARMTPEEKQNLIKKLQDQMNNKK